MKLGSVQQLRGIAAIMVAYRHSVELQAAWSAKPSLQQSWTSFSAFGSAGVDIFFVISGFIISFSAAKYLSPRGGLEFLSRRFTRIMPLYYLTTILLAALFIPHLLKEGIPLYYTARVLKSIILLPLFDGPVFLAPINPIAWTLSFEWWFYILFFIAIRIGKKYKEIVLIGEISLLVVVGASIGSHHEGIVFMTNPLMLEFMLGILIYLAYLHWRPTLLLSLFCIIAAVGSFAWEIGNHWNLGRVEQGDFNGRLALHRFLIWGIPASLLVCGAVFLEKGGFALSFWRNRLGNLLGNASYSIYLIHWPLFALLPAIYRRWGYFPNADLGVFIQLLAAILAGVFLYKTVEAPLLRRRARRGINPALPKEI